jgi:NAD(P)-dependent dehydrogenase (short-subunit alcohol dehydrogenase family)
MEKMKKNRKHVLITGTGRGLGAALCRVLLGRENTLIYGISRGDNPFEGNPGYTHIRADLSDPTLNYADLTAHFSSAPPDVIINNAAMLLNKPFGTYTLRDLETQFHLNVFAPFLFLQALGPFLREGSHVVNIGSMGGFQGSAKFPGLSAYSATKGALAVFTECLAEEWKDRGIRVNCLALGSVNTEMLSEAFPGYKAPIDPEEMAVFVADFALNGHQFFSGKVLPVSISVP